MRPEKNNKAMMTVLLLTKKEQQRHTALHAVMTHSPSLFASMAVAKDIWSI